jgi:hypothetical protein
MQRRYDRRDYHRGVICALAVTGAIVALVFFIRRRRKPELPSETLLQEKEVRHPDYGQVRPSGAVTYGVAPPFRPPMAPPKVSLVRLSVERHRYISADHRMDNMNPLIEMCPKRQQAERRHHTKSTDAESAPIVIRSRSTGFDRATRVTRARQLIHNRLSQVTQRIPTFPHHLKHGKKAVCESRHSGR